MIPTGCQIREGRRLVGVSQLDLAQAAKVTFDLLIRAELADGMPQLTRRESSAIQQALETAGVEFVREDGGPGVRLRKVEPS